MGNLKAFLKQNKKAKKTTQFAATKSLCDENGDPLLWTIRPLSTKESAAIRDECTIEVPVTGKPGLYRQKVNTDELLRKMICAAVVEPDLHNAELQDSYGVMSAEALIVEMVDNPEERPRLGRRLRNRGISLEAGDLARFPTLARLVLGLVAKKGQI